uniref:Expressed protein n=2 Tax=Oryza sativa subsp. japonica TaxID=39947 RepID=Q2QMV7_ORYSJ|nr:expressed protein [Oryza sativa Japonica Group]
MSPPPPRRSRARPRRPPDTIHSWIILDRCAHCSDGDVVGDDDDDDVTASESAHTCSGRRIRASLRVADPPAVSRLHLHRLDGPWPDAYDLHHAEVLAAHNGAILFRTGVPFSDPGFVAPGHFPVDYFVYTAGGGAAASPPSLTRLPPCFIGGFSDPAEDEYYKPYRVQRQRIMLGENIGFLSGDVAGEFTVADIRNYDGNSLELCIFNHHATLPSPSPEQSPEQWRIQRVPKIGDDDELPKWVNDLVLPLHGHYLCCVDFYNGILLIDADNLQQFSYIPLPEEAMNGSRRVDDDEDDPDPARRVSVTGAGLVTLVCVDKIATRGKITRDFTIKSWDDGRDWIVEIDMVKRAMRSPVALYIHEEEEGEGEGEGEERECGGGSCMLWKAFFGHYFIPSWFPSYLHEDPIQSRKRSETMQKAKQERTMDKSGTHGNVETGEGKTRVCNARQHRLVAYGNGSNEGLAQFAAG